MKSIRTETDPTESVRSKDEFEAHIVKTLQGSSVNFHLWQPCNMRCKFCFATFLDVKETVLPKGHLPREQSMAVVQLLGAAQVGKITFAGGEPLLCPWLPDLIKEAKRLGMTTMIVTNGTRISPEWLASVQGYLDWVTLSVDSVNPAINSASGRHEIGKAAPDLQFYLERGKLIKSSGIRLKINTVVSVSNLREDLTGLVCALKPERWKVLQALAVEGQNSAHAGKFEIDHAEFEAFITRHSSLENVTTIVPEPVESIKGSYLMIDPAGRFYDDVNGSHTYSRPVLEVGLEAALAEVTFDFEKFLQRGGKYAY